MLQFIYSYKNGFYLNDILEILNEKQIQKIDEMQRRFLVAITLYELNNERYNTLLNDFAKRYFDYFIADKSFAWEPFTKVFVSEKSLTRGLSFSACCIYFFYKEDKAFAFSALLQMFKSKKSVDRNLLLLLYELEGENAFPFFAAALKSEVETTDYLQKTIASIQKHFPPETYTTLLWGLVAHKSRPLRNTIAGVLAQNDKDAEIKAIQILQNGKVQARETAATILGAIASENAQKAIAEVVDSELRDETRDILLQIVKNDNALEPTFASVQAMIDAARKRGKLDKPIDASINEAELPELFYLDGSKLNTDDIRFLFYRMSRTKLMRSDIEANAVIQLLDREKASPFAQYLLKIFTGNGAKPEQKYFMTLAALIGDDKTVERIKILINRWIEEQRSKMAEYGVGALALQGSNKALRLVEWYSRKYKSKKANVGTAALAALEAAAEELDITIKELGDRIVPDFGFDGLFKTFEAGGETYRAFVDSNFKINFFDEDNKKLKAVPAATDKELKEEFKTIAKEIREITKSQSSRLEYYLVIQRKWNFEQWQLFFLNNPVMFIYATKLLWGIYNSEGGLLQTFLCNEDTSLLNIEEEEIEIAEDANIGIVYPSQLDAELLKQWQRLFFDLSVQPIFPQLDRKVPDISDLNLDSKIITNFAGKRMKEGSTTSTLLKFGWAKGASGDGGYLESFNLLYFEKKLEAVLEVEGIGAGYGWGGEERLGKLYILDKTKAKQKYNYVQKDDDERLVSLKEVPTIFLSEMIAAIKAIKPFAEKASNA